MEAFHYYGSSAKDLGFFMQFKLFLFQAIKFKDLNFLRIHLRSITSENGSDQVITTYLPLIASDYAEEKKLLKLDILMQLHQKM